MGQAGLKRGSRIFVSAGEVSGDRILGDILTRLREEFPDPELRGLGGAAAEACGLRPLFPIARTAFSGAWDVIRNGGFAARMSLVAARTLRSFRPDLVLLVDYPGLNLRLARLARNLGIPVLFAAPPQAWVYRDPARKLRRAASALRGCHLHVLFPFEREAFASVAAGITVGHFLTTPEGSRSDAPPLQPKGPLLLCPGSRLPVLRRNLPAWLDLLERTGRLRGCIDVLTPEPMLDAASEILAGFVGKRVAGPGDGSGPVDNGRFGDGRFGRVILRTDKDRAFAEADRAIAFPGTITLELALARIPTLVLAILDPLTLALGRRVLGHRRLALPNLLAGESVFPEWAGTWPGPDPRRYLDLERERDGDPGMAGRLERLALRLGPADGAEKAAAACASILRGSRAPETSRIPAEMPPNP